MNHTRPSDAALDGQDQREEKKDDMDAERGTDSVRTFGAAGAAEAVAGEGGQPAEPPAEPSAPDGDAVKTADRAESGENAEEPGGSREEGPEEPDKDGEAEKYRLEAERCKQEAEKYKREAEETYQRLIRLQADYDNFRRRTRQEKEEFAKYASASLIGKLLPVLDNFERALAAKQSAADLDSFARGVDMIYRQFSEVLAQEGLEPIKAVGEPFNPEFHQAIMRVESEEHDDNIIVEELQKGYKLKGKVIRPSMVKVNARP